jgi:uncharacterized repeat protein (TIGR03803 family)
MNGAFQQRNRICRANTCPTIISRTINFVTLAAAALLVSVVAAQSAQAQTFTALHEFSGPPDGASPTARLIRDSSGNFFGTTYNGGANGFGAVFVVDATGRETVLHSFDGSIAAYPFAGLLRDGAGNFYGALSYNIGTVFKLNTKGEETELHVFSGTDGSDPQGDLVRDSEGNLYGTTCFGGMSDYGTVFKLNLSGTYQVLHSFTGGTDGAYPIAGVRRDAAGNLYGTASEGGDSNLGTVFKIDTTGETVALHSFSGPDGATPYGTLIWDAAGNIYGVTYYGGTSNAGTVFKIATTGKETVLHNFTDTPDGANPVAGLIRDAAGTLYGTTAHGGSSGFGTVFRVRPTGQLTLLHSFSGSDGAYPYPGLTWGALGALYGTTNNGGTFGVGVVFKITL